MKLLMISTDRKIFEKGSAVALRQAEYAKGYEEVHIIILAPGKRERSKEGKILAEDSETVVSSNCWAYSTQSSLKILSPLDAIRLGRFIIEKRKITNITCQDPFLTGMAGVSLKKQFNIPLELQLHVDIGSPYFGYTLSNRIRKILARSYLQKADSIRVVSERIKKYLIERLGIEDSKITVRPIAANVEWIKSAPITTDLHKKYQQFDKIVMMASRLEAEKNIALAIHSWAEVLKAVPKAGLIIVGSGSLLSRLMALSSRLNLGDSVIFENWVEPGMLASYYKTADLFLSTSLYEGYGLTFVEAQAAGCPIVSTDVGIAKEKGADIVAYEPSDVARGIIGMLNR